MGAAKGVSNITILTEFGALYKCISFVVFLNILVAEILMVNFNFVVKFEDNSVLQNIYFGYGQQVRSYGNRPLLLLTLKLNFPKRLSLKSHRSGCEPYMWRQQLSLLKIACICWLCVVIY